MCELRDEGRASPRPLLILIADDNEVLRRSIRELLGAFGHCVEVVGDGRAAVEAASGRHYDLLILDIQMPGLGGYEVSGLLRRGSVDGRRMFIVGLSGEEADPTSFEAAGMDDFLVKPVRLVEMVRLLGKVADHLRFLVEAEPGRLAPREAGESPRHVHVA